MSRIYLDNAATTPLDPQVLEAMLPYYTTHFGNPSSIHSHGREVRSAIEKARKTVANLLSCSPSEIIFTSGGTEADNSALVCLGTSPLVQHIISSPLEHHAVLHTLDKLQAQGHVQVHYLHPDERGRLSLAELESLLQQHPQALVSLMHGNNEVATLNDLEAIGSLCRQYEAYFHSDTVQTMGHYRHTLNTLPVDMVVGSAHKFHGPKGVGFLYLRGGLKIAPFISGGAQERNMRGGTENVAGIVGLAKALELAYAHMDEHRAHITALKARMMQALRLTFDDIRFNGDSDNLEGSLYTVLNVSLPASDTSDMLLFNLDIEGVSASGGSACSSGSDIGSHVLSALGCDKNRGAVRFSFSRLTTEAEVDRAVEILARVYGPSPSVLATHA